MAKIQNLPKARLTLGQFLTAGITIKQKLDTVNLSVLLIKTQKESYDLALENFNNSMTKITKSEYTTKMSALKNRSNKSRNGFFLLIKGNLTSSVAAQREAANSLIILANRFKNISRMVYDDYIAHTRRMIDLCKSDEYKEHITTLKLDDRVTELETINNESMKLTELRIGESGNRNRLRKTTITRREFTIAYDNLVKRLNALAEVNGDADYIELFAWWNALIDKYRVAISLRYGGTQGGTTDNGSNNHHDPNTGGNTNEEDRPEIEQKN